MSLYTSAAPGVNFDLDEWKLQLPVDAAGGFTGSYTEIRDLDTYTSSYFYTGPDGAMVLRVPVEGVTTSGSSYARTELRELNGVSSTPTNAAWTLEQGGYLTVAMQVDEVPRKLDGTDAKIVIGQIHGGDHQLVRLYYEKGSIYWVSGRNEVQAKDAVHRFKDDQGNTPQVSLNETFVYTMDVKGHDLTLTLKVDGKVYTSSITIGPGWDDNQFYFKAGLYLGTNETNSTGDGQVSIFGIDVTHDGSKPVLTVPGATADAPSSGSKTVPVSEPETQGPELVNETAPAHTSPVFSDNGIVATLQGTSGNDVFSVSQKATVVVAGYGVDTVRSSASWVMSSGVEVLQLTGTGSISGTGTSANDTIRGNEAANCLKGYGGQDKLDGQDGDDMLLGGLGGDWLFGEDGNDILNGGAGTDWLEGGAGNDIYVLAESGDTVVEALDAGTDQVNAGYSYTLEANLENLLLTGTAAINGTGNALANRLTGNGASNILKGLDGADRLEGGAGNDSLDGGAGNDQILGESGGDTLTLDAGDDTLNGGADIDWLHVTGSSAAMIDLVKTTAQATGYGNDIVLNIENASGGSGADKMYGNSSTNMLHGNAGDDLLHGRAGADTLIGGLGRDSLYGGSGDGVCDMFVFASTAESAVGNKRDVIYNFVSGIDDIDLVGIDANTAASGDQAFAFSGTTAQAHCAWYATSNFDLIVRGDMNGDKIADFEIRLIGVNSLTESDFLL